MLQEYLVTSLLPVFLKWLFFLKPFGMMQVFGPSSTWERVLYISVIKILLQTEARLYHAEG